MGAGRHGGPRCSHLLHLHKLAPQRFIEDLREKVWATRCVAIIAAGRACGAEYPSEACLAEWAGLAIVFDNVEKMCGNTMYEAYLDFKRLFHLHKRDHPKRREVRHWGLLPEDPAAHRALFVNGEWEHAFEDFLPAEFVGLPVGDITEEKLRAVVARIPRRRTNIRLSRPGVGAQHGEQQDAMGMFKQLFERFSNAASSPERVRFMGPQIRGAITSGGDEELQQRLGKMEEQLQQSQHQQSQLQLQLQQSQRGKGDDDKREDKRAQRGKGDDDKREGKREAEESEDEEASALAADGVQAPSSALAAINAELAAAGASIAEDRKRQAVITRAKKSLQNAQEKLRLAEEAAAEDKPGAGTGKRQNKDQGKDQGKGTSAAPGKKQGSTPSSSRKRPKLMETGGVVTYRGAVITDKPDQKKLRLFTPAAIVASSGCKKMDCDYMYASRPRDAAFAAVLAKVEEIL